MYSNLVEVYSQLLDYYKKLPEGESFTQRDKYYLIEGLSVALNALTGEAEFVKDEVPIEVLQELLVHIKQNPDVEKEIILEMVEEVFHEE